MNKIFLAIANGTLLAFRKNNTVTHGTCKEEMP